MKTTIKISALALCLSLFGFAPVKTTTASKKEFSRLTNSIEWKSTELELGDITHNQPKPIEFEFTNTGKGAVIITNVVAGCGCTSVSFDKEPVAPGQVSKVKAVFNAASVGAFRKTVSVYIAGEEAPVTLVFKGKVI